MESAEPSAPQDEHVGDHDEQRGGFGSLGSIIYLLVLTWAAAIASFPLNDNSFFTHLATGRLILDEGSVPSSDPYTFTANGEPWTVQSWLASVAYAGAERIAGGQGIKALVLMVTLGAAAVLWRLTRSATSIIVRLTLMLLALLVAGSAWSERPYMVGVVGVGVLLLMFDRQVPVGWAVPLMWTWANVHGSFPFGLLLCMLVLAGELADQKVRGGAVDVQHELRVLVAVGLGTLASLAGPLGIRALTFPAKVISGSDVLLSVKEWQPPDFGSLSERVFLVIAAMAILAVVRSGRMRCALPVVFFLCASVVAQRNIPLALMVFVPAIACSAPTVGSLRSATRPAFGFLMTALAAVLFLVFGAAAVLRSDPALGGYASRQLSWIEDRVAGAGHRVALQERNGNLLEALDGADGSVFFDDRFDMFPEDVSEDYLTLLSARPGWDGVLDRYDIDVVVWERSRPLAALLVASSDWHVVLSDTAWTVACRRGVECPAAD